MHDDLELNNKHGVNTYYTNNLNEYKCLSLKSN